MENKRTVRAVKLSNIEDITAYSIGEYLNYGHKWVDFGKDNDYPSFLRNLYLTSPTNQAIIDGVTNLATGEGVEVLEPEKNPISNKWVNDNFDKKTIKSLISDLKTYGFCLVQVYSGNMVKYTEALKYRFDVKDKTGQINYMWFSNDWDNYMDPKNRPVKLPIYYEGCTEPLSLCLVQLEKKGYDYYSPVDYNGAVNYITLESEISKYHLSNIKNGLFPSFVITFIGSEFSDEQMAQIEADINKKFGGSGNTGRAIIAFAANKDDATQLQTIEQPNIDNTYTFLSEECSKKIMVGHGVTSPIMFGIRDTGGGLGNNAEELEQSFYLFYESKLKHYQNYILEMIKKIMNGNLLFANVQFKTYNPFATKDSTQTLSSVERLNEIQSQDILDKIDELKIKPEGILINEKLFTNVKEGKLYKYVKASNNNTIVNKKLEILDKGGYRFTPSDLIKNCADYYFLEQTYIPNTNK